jgi:serine protein kinase
MSLIKKFEKSYASKSHDEMSLSDYLTLCKKDELAYASAAERLLDAIGEPNIVDTSTTPRLSRIFLNRTIKVYPAFEDFYGMEEAIERLVAYFRQSAQGLEEKKQVLYLLGPVGGGKSSLAERLKELMQMHPMYVLKAGDEISPVFESPLGLFDPKEFGADAEKEFGIPSRYLTGLLSPWAVKRLDEYEGDISKFSVVKMYPSKLKQIGIMKTEPGDDNNQDISALVGKTDIRKLEYFSQNDPDSYAFSGALCRGNQGIMEFVEMFKAPIKVLHPLLTATQEGNYMGTEGISAIPFNGIVVAHSNESEWETFRNNKNNEAFLDRVYIVKVPYCLRATEETSIYKKMLDSSGLDSSKCAPHTLDLLSQFSVLSRLKEHKNSNLAAKMRVYDGENLHDVDPKAKSMQEYKDVAGVDEGMNGMSTRFAFKILSQTFNFDSEEIAADPVHLMYVLETAIKREQFPEEMEEQLLGFIKDHLSIKYAEQVGKEIQKAYLESYNEYGQNLFDRYLDYADHWIQNIDYKDADTGNLFDRSVLNEELEKIEKPAGIANPKDFRNEVVNWVLRARSNYEGKNPPWTAYEKMKEVIEHKMFAGTEELLPVISFGSKKTKEDQSKHDDFIDRMTEKGYTARQVKRLVEWYMRVQKSN